MRISDWSSDVCSSDLAAGRIDGLQLRLQLLLRIGDHLAIERIDIVLRQVADRPQEIAVLRHDVQRSEEHTSELQPLMRSSYAALCLKKKNRRKLSQPKAKDHTRYLLSITCNSEQHSHERP